MVGDGHAHQAAAAADLLLCRCFHGDGGEVLLRAQAKGWCTGGRVGEGLEGEEEGEMERGRREGAGGSWRAALSGGGEPPPTVGGKKKKKPFCLLLACVAGKHTPQDQCSESQRSDTQHAATETISGPSKILEG